MASIWALPHGLRRLYGFLRADEAPHPNALTLLEGSTDEESAKRLYHLIQYNSCWTWSQRTWPGRHRELDEMLAEEIRAAFPPDRAIHIHDMGASSGITSMELFERLSRDRASVHVHASDYYDALYVVSLPQSHWQVVFNRALAPIQFVGRGLAISARSMSSERGTKRLLRFYLRARKLPRAFEILCAGLHGPGGETGDTARQRIKTISLFDPRCKALALADARFTLGREDFMNPTSGPHHLIRLMNYRLSPLTPRNFSAPSGEIQNLLSAIHRSLHADGLFVIGSTAEDDTQGAATLFRRSTGGFVTVRNFNSGSILRSKVESFLLTESAPVGADALPLQQTRA